MRARSSSPRASGERCPPFAIIPPPPREYSPSDSGDREEDGSPYATRPRYRAETIPDSQPCAGSIRQATTDPPRDGCAPGRGRRKPATHPVSVPGRRRRRGGVYRIPRERLKSAGCLCPLYRPPLECDGDGGTVERCLECLERARGRAGEIRGEISRLGAERRAVAPAKHLSSRRVIDGTTGVRTDDGHRPESARACCCDMNDQNLVAAVVAAERSPDKPAHALKVRLVRECESDLPAGQGRRTYPHIGVLARLESRQNHGASQGDCTRGTLQKRPARKGGYGGHCSVSGKHCQAMTFGGMQLDTRRSYRFNGRCSRIHREERGLIENLRNF